VVYDGRVDNRQELLSLLADRSGPLQQAPDSDLMRDCTRDHKTAGPALNAQGCVAAFDGVPGR